MIRTESGRTSKSWRKSWVKAKSQEFVRVKFEGGEAAGAPLASCSYMQVDQVGLDLDLGHPLACLARPGLSSWPNHTSAQPEEAGPEKGAGSYSLLWKSSRTTSVSSSSSSSTSSSSSHTTAVSSSSSQNLDLPQSEMSERAGCALPHFWQIYK